MGSNPTILTILKNMINPRFRIEMTRKYLDGLFVKCSKITKDNDFYYFKTLGDLLEIKVSKDNNNVVVYLTPICPEDKIMISKITTLSEQATNFLKNVLPFEVFVLKDMIMK